MRVFLTGATGFVGSAAVPELLEAGHEVLGLARSDEAAAKLAAAGAEPHRGSLEDPESLRAGAAAADGVIHCAYIHDFTDIGASAAKDERAIETIGAELAGSGRPFVVTSGTAGLPAGRVGTEDDEAPGAEGASHRIPAELKARALAEQGVRSVVLRLPPSVHGEGDHGFVPAVIGVARERGVSGYPGDGANRWPAVHRLDAARLFRLALESAPAGAVVHAVGDEGIPVREIAAVIGRQLGLPTRSIAAAEVARHFGWIGTFFALDVPASSALTQQSLDWRPTHQGLIADLEEGHYFQVAAVA